jgi:hypothetical protein
MRIAYIDPGYKGAAVLFEGSKPLDAFKFIKEGKNINVQQIELVLISWQVEKVYLENIMPRPLQSATSTFYQGVAFGAALTVSQLCCVPVELIPPQTWTAFTKRLSRAPQRTSKEIAQELTKRFFHDFASAYKSKRAKKYHDGIADCLCIQIYVNRDSYLDLLE